MFELNKYEKQVETNISICFILMLMSDLGTAVAWVGLAACVILFGQLVYYPFRCNKKEKCKYARHQKDRGIVTVASFRYSISVFFCSVF